MLHDLIAEFDMIYTRAARFGLQAGVERCRLCPRSFTAPPTSSLRTKSHAFRHAA
jgi:hypothetical protein